MTDNVISPKIFTTEGVGPCSFVRGKERSPGAKLSFSYGDAQG